MASVNTPSNEAAVSVGGRVLEFEEYIDRRVASTRMQLKLHELMVAALMGLVSGVSIFLAFALLDAWVVPGGLNTPFRWLGAACCLGVALWIAIRRIAPLFAFRINPLYAAKSIEDQVPNLKNRVLNFLMLRHEPSGAKQEVIEVVRRQAAAGLTHIAGEAVIDRADLVKLGYCLLAITAVTVLYSVVSPKNPLRTMQRILLPWADIAAPTRVNLVGISPGDAAGFHGDSVAIEVIAENLLPRDQVVLHWTTLDRPDDWSRVPLAAGQEKNTFRGQLPEGKAGLRTELLYRITAGDAASRVYRIKVFAAPTILVERVFVDYPAYTGLQDQTVERQGDFRAVEGTILNFTASANQAIQRAWIDFDAMPKLELAPREQQATGAVTFALPQQHSHEIFTTYYQVRFQNAQSEINPRPVKHVLEMVPDMPPEVETLSPRENEVVLAENEELAFEWQARDPDFALAGVDLSLKKNNTAIDGVSLLKESWAGRYVARWTLKPTELKLKAGDSLSVVAAVRDNKAPSANSVESKPVLVRLLPPPEQDPNRQNEQKNEQQTGQQENQPGGQQQGQQGKDQNERQNGKQTPKQNQEPSKQGDNERGQKGGAQGDNKPNQNQNQQQDSQAGNEDSQDSQQPNQQGNQGKDEGKRGTSDRRKQEQPPSEQGDTQSNQGEGGGQSDSGDNSRQPQSKQGDDPSQEQQPQDNQQQSDSSSGKQGKSGTGKGQPKGSEGQPSSEDLDRNDQENADSASDEQSNGAKTGDNQKRGDNSNAGKQGGSNGQSDLNRNGQNTRKDDEQSPNNSQQGANADNEPASQDQQAPANGHDAEPKSANGKRPEGNAAGQRQQSAAKHDGEAFERMQEHFDQQQQQGQPSGDDPSENASSEQKPAGRNQDGNAAPQPPVGAEEEGAEATKRQRPLDKQDGPGDSVGQGGESQEGTPQGGGDSEKVQGKNGSSESESPSQNQAASDDGRKGPGKRSNGHGESSQEEQPSDDSLDEKPSNGQQGEDAGRQQQNGQRKVGNHKPGEGATSEEEQEQGQQSGKPRQDEGGARKEGEQSAGDKSGEKGADSQNDAQSSSSDQQQGGKENARNEKGEQSDAGNPDKPTTSREGATGESRPTDPKQEATNAQRESSDQDAQNGEKGSDPRNSDVGQDGSEDRGEDQANGHPNLQGKQPNDQQPHHGKGEQPRKGENGELPRKGENGEQQQPLSSPSGKQSDGDKPQPDDSKQPSDESDASNGQPDGESAEPNTDRASDNLKPNSAKRPRGPDAPPADAVNEEYAKQATDLVLERLVDQRKQGKSDTELLKKLGWTQEQLDAFVRRWESMREAAKAPGQDGESAKRELDEALRSLGLAPKGAKLAADRVQQDAEQGLQQSKRSEPPSKYRDGFRAFTRGLMQGKSGK